MASAHIAETLNKVDDNGPLKQLATNDKCIFKDDDDDDEALFKEIILQSNHKYDELAVEVDHLSLLAANCGSHGASWFVSDSNLQSDAYYFSPSDRPPDSSFYLSLSPMPRTGFNQHAMPCEYEKCLLNRINHIKGKNCFRNHCRAQQIGTRIKPFTFFKFFHRAFQLTKSISTTTPVIN
jgi:hypothetical protein